MVFALLLSLLLFSVGSQGTASSPLKQQTNSPPVDLVGPLNNPAISAAFATASNIGNTVFVVVYYRNEDKMALGSVEDDGGNSYSLYEKVNSLAKPVGMAFYFTSATTAAQTITVTFGGLLANDTATVALWVYEFVGLSLSPGGSTKLSGSGSPRHTGSYTAKAGGICSLLVAMGTMSTGLLFPDARFSNLQPLTLPDPYALVIAGLQVLPGVAVDFVATVQSGDDWGLMMVEWFITSELYATCVTLGGPLPSSASGTLVGDFYVAAGTALSFSSVGNITVTGNLTILGTLTLLEGVRLSVGGDLIIENTLTSSNPITVGGTLILAAGATFVPVLASEPPVGTLTITVASYGSVTGSFTSVGTPLALYDTSTSCASLGTPSVSQGSLSIVVNIQVTSSCPPSPGNTVGSTLSLGAIIGIAVGGGVVVVLVIVGVIIAFQQRGKKRAFWLRVRSTAQELQPVDNGVH